MTRRDLIIQQIEEQLGYVKKFLEYADMAEYPMLKQQHKAEARRSARVLGQLAGNLEEELMREGA